MLRPCGPTARPPSRPKPRWSTMPAMDPTHPRDMVSRRSLGGPSLACDDEKGPRSIR